MSFDQYFSSGFNPALFLYLNPTLNLVSVEQAMSYSNAIGYSSNIDTIPSGLDPRVFISENRQTLDISNLNSNIKNVMLNDSSLIEIEEDGVYFPTIYRSCINIGSNIFKINKPGEQSMFFSPCNLQVNDKVKLTKKTGQDFYGRVDQIIDNQTILLDFQGNLVINDTTSSYDYILYGIKLYDPLRLSRINYLRLFGTHVPSNLIDIDSNFNYKLYELLYPDSRNLNKEDAFVDYTNRKGNNDDRIAKVTDFDFGGNQQVSITGSQVEVSSLIVSQHLDLSFGQETGRITWNNQDLYYVTNDVCRPVAGVSPYFPGLITEYAIKNYIYNLFWPLATFSNVNITGTEYVNTLYSSNLTVNGDAIFNSNVYVNENLFAGRVGIGCVPLESPPLPNISSNIDLGNVHIDESLYVGGITQCSGPLLGNTACFTSDVNAYKFGIGSGGCLDHPQNNVYCDELFVGNYSTQSNNEIVATINGIIVANNINPISDAKLKQNIQIVPHPVADFPNVVSFSYINDEKRRLGFLAQDLEECFPEAVLHSKLYKMYFKKPRPFTCEYDDAGLTTLDTQNINYNLVTEDFVIIQNKIVKIISSNEKEIILEYKTRDDILYVDGFIYNQVKMVDFTQIIMLLVQQVKELKSLIQ